MEKILVTGVNGFVGHHLTNELKDSGFGVVGLGREDSASPDVDGLLESYISCDLTDKEAVKKISLDGIKAVINLAGLAAVGPSFDNPELYMKVNVEVLTNLIELIKSGSFSSRLVAISTGAVYASDQQMPLSEISRTTAASPYAASKLAMEKAARDFKDAGGNCVIARPFNHIGPGQLPGFLLPDLYEKIKDADGSEIKVGNIKTQRDFTDVRDVAKAYIALATHSELAHDTYNVCSGVPRSGEDILELVKKAADRADITAAVDESLFRPSDAPVLYGDNTRINKDTGWEPAIPLEQTVSDFVDSK